MTHHLLILCFFYASLAAAEMPGLEPAVAGEMQRTLASPQSEDRVAALRSLCEYRGGTALSLAQPLLRHADPLTRAEAVATVAALDRKAGMQAVTMAAGDKDGRVRAAAVRALAALEGIKAVNGLLRARADKDVRVRRAMTTALTGLAIISDPAQAKVLADAAVGLLEDSDVPIRLAALDLAAALPGNAGQAVLLAACRSRCEEIVTRAAERILKSGQAESAAKALAAQVAAAPLKERLSGLIALGVLAHPAGLPAVASSLTQVDSDLRCAAMEVIAGCADDLDPQETHRFEELLLTQLSDRDWGVRATAAETLARIGSAKAPGLLIDLLGKTKDPDAKAVRTALMCLSQRSDLSSAAQWAEWWKRSAISFLPARGKAPPQVSSVSFYEVTDTFTEAVFVVDVSGSMADKGPEGGYKTKEDKTKISGAKRELQQTVLDLAGGTRFNVIFFSNAARLWHDGPLRATWRAKRALQRELEAVGPNGGTNTHDALELAFAQPDFDAIFLLTDGMPTVGVTDTKQILKDVMAWNAERQTQIRIHSIAFFIEEAKDFLSQLATGNHGQYRLVN